MFRLMIGTWLLLSRAAIAGSGDTRSDGRGALRLPRVAGFREGREGAGLPLRDCARIVKTASATRCCPVFLVA